MIYVVFWVISNIIQIPCPDIHTDPYNPKSVVRYGCNVFHSRVEQDTFHKFFLSKIEADSFVAGMPERLRIKVYALDSIQFIQRKTWREKWLEKWLEVDTSAFYSGDSLYIDSSLFFFIQE